MLVCLLMFNGTFSTKKAQPISRHLVEFQFDFLHVMFLKLFSSVRVVIGEEERQGYGLVVCQIN